MKLAAVVVSAVAAATSALAAPNPSKRAEDPIRWPYRTYRYWVETGKIIDDPQDQPIVYKAVGQPKYDTTAILTFAPDRDLVNRTCELRFRLKEGERDFSHGSPDDPTVPAQADVFTVRDFDPSTFNDNTASERRPDAHDPKDRSKAKARDHWKGRAVFPNPGWAKLIDPENRVLQFDCPTEDYIAVEYVGAGEHVVLRWMIGATGPIMVVLPSEEET